MKNPPVINVYTRPIYLIHSPDLQSQLVHHSDEELKNREGGRMWQMTRQCLKSFPASALSKKKQGFFTITKQRYLTSLTLSWLYWFLSLIQWVELNLTGDTTHLHDLRMSQINWNYISHLVLKQKTLNPSRKATSCLQCLKWQWQDRTYRNYICNAAVQVALVILDGDWSILLNPFHGQWAVKLGDKTATARSFVKQNHRNISWTIDHWCLLWSIELVIINFMTLLLIHTA